MIWIMLVLVFAIAPSCAAVTTGAIESGRTLGKMAMIGEDAAVSSRVRDDKRSGDHGSGHDRPACTMRNH